MNVDDAWLHLRSSLADPPGQAARDSRRQETYISALLQFEQLTRAAQAVAAYARPLPLYYAAHQAARALAAAFGQVPDARGHGLHQISKDIPHEIMSFSVGPKGDKHLLAELCSVTACGVPDVVSLAELFLSLPDLSDKPHVLRGWKAIYVERVPDPTEYAPLPDPHVRIALETEQLPAGEDLLRVYPRLQGWHEESDRQTGITSRRQLARVFRSKKPIPYRDRQNALDHVAPTYRYSGDRWLVPTVGQLDDPLSPLATWYTLLFGFSILARYEPAAWMKALDVRQPHSVAIEASLEEGTRALPELLWKQITLLRSPEEAEGDLPP